jgi:putative flippase GtrA
MDLRPSAVLSRFRGKAFRYISVSVIGTVITQGQIWFYLSVLGWGGALSNFVAVTVSTIPGYLLSRYWVWAGREASWRRDVVPFWALTLAGLVLSTLFAALADHFFSQAWVVNLANLAGFGVLWLAKFMILDEYLFKSEPPPLLEI